MLFPVPMLFEIDKKGLDFGVDRITDAIRTFCNEVNFGKDESFVYLDTDDKVYAMCEVIQACFISDNYNKLDFRDKFPYDFYKENDLGEGLRDEDFTNFICRCLDRLYRNLGGITDFDVVNNSIKVVINDVQGTQFKFKWVKSMDIEATDTSIDYYKRTVDGFSAVLIEKGEDVSKYSCKFNPIVVPQYIEEKENLLLFAVAVIGYDNKVNEMIEGVLKAYKVSSELDLGKKLNLGF